MLRSFDARRTLDPVVRPRPSLPHGTPLLLGQSSSGMAVVCSAMALTVDYCIAAVQFRDSELAILVQPLCRLPLSAVVVFHSLQCVERCLLGLDSDLGELRELGLAMVALDGACIRYSLVGCSDNLVVRFRMCKRGVYFSRNPRGNMAVVDIRRSRTSAAAAQQAQTHISLDDHCLGSPARIESDR